MYRRKYKKCASLADSRRFNRLVIWPQRRINRLIMKYDKHLVRLAALKCRQWGTSPQYPELLLKSLEAAKVTKRKNFISKHIKFTTK